LSPSVIFKEYNLKNNHQVPKTLRKQSSYINKFEMPKPIYLEPKWEDFATEDTEELGAFALK